jgi:cellulose synthase/poly-beta-1,6-N-acetylglucosamine synthase-like glycosyltransferase
VNEGISRVPDAEFVGCLDADSFVSPEALREIIGHFENPRVAAVTPAMSVHNPRNPLEHMQNAEYIFGISLRHILASVNALYVTPGPFSFYRRSVFMELGGFRKAYDTEDLEMALRTQRAGYLIENAPRARVYTKTPKTIPALIKQRTRWTTGFVRNVLFDYRDLVGNPKYGTLGLIVLPLGCIAILGGIFVFLFSLFQFLHSVYSVIILSKGIPLSYTLALDRLSFDFFFVPITAVILLGMITLTGSVTLMLTGKRISGTKGSLMGGIFAYVFLYGMIAPLWLMRTVFDVATGAKRPWR